MMLILAAKLLSSKNPLFCRGPGKILRGQVKYKLLVQLGQLKKILNGLSGAPRLHLFDQKYSKQQYCEMLLKKCIYIYIIYLTWNLFL